MPKKDDWIESVENDLDEMEIGYNEKCSKR